MPEEQGQQLQPERQLQSKPDPKPSPTPTPTPTLRTILTPTGVTSIVPTLTRQCETVPPQNQTTLARQSLAPTTGSRMSNRHRIIRRGKSVLLPNNKDQPILSAINRALFHQQAPAYSRIMNARKNSKSAIQAIRHQNSTAEIALQYHDIISTTARNVDKVIVDVHVNESWERLQIHAVPFVRYMGKGTEGRQKMREAFAAEPEGIAIPTQV